MYVMRLKNVMMIAIYMSDDDDFRHISYTKFNSEQIY